MSRVWSFTLLALIAAGWVAAIATLTGVIR
jgi:hypothetical protein